MQWLRNETPANFQNFYQLAAKVTAKETEALIRCTATVAKEQSWGYAEEGQFRPLGYWKQQGYDVASIEANAPPEDKEQDPVYGWTNFRVRVKATHQGEQHRTTDVLQVLAKARTRALKRRRTDEESLPQEAEPSSDFSDEESGGSESEDPRDKRRRERRAAKSPIASKAKAKAAGKKKPKKSPEEIALEKEIKKYRDEASAAAKKVKVMIAALQTTASHRYILDVPEDLLRAVSTRTKSLQALEKKCLDAAAGKGAQWRQEYDAVDWKDIKKEKQALQKKLQKLEKAF